MTDTATLVHAPCKYCGGPVTPPKRRGLVKDFCRDRCRAAYRDQRLAQAAQQAQQAVQECRATIQAGMVTVEGVLADIAQTEARLAGAAQLLERLTAKKPRNKKENKVVDTVSSPDQLLTGQASNPAH